MFFIAAKWYFIDMIFAMLQVFESAERYKNGIVFMDKKEKAVKVGDFLLDTAKIVFAGLVISKLPTGLSEYEFLFGCILFILLCILGFVLVFVKRG